MRYRIRYIALGFFLLLLFCTGVVFCTDKGLVAVKRSVNLLGGGVVEIESVEGRLLDSFAINRMKIANSLFELQFEHLGVSWNPGSLFFGTLHLRNVELNEIEFTIKEFSQTSTFELSSLKVLSPFGIRIEQLSMQHGSLLDVVDGKPIIELDSFQLSIDGDFRGINIQRLDVNGTDIGLALEGTIVPDQDWQVDLQGNWQLAGFGFHPMGGIFSLDGRLEELDVDTTLVTPGHIRVQGVLENLLERPQWTATLSANDFDLSTWIIDCPEIKLFQVSGELAGDFGNYGGKVQAHGAWDMFDNLYLVSELDGDGSGILFHSLRIDQNEGYARADGGTISWETLFSWAADFHVENFNPAIFTEKLSGKLNGDFTSIGDVTESGVDATFSIDHIDGIFQNMNVHLSGDMSLDENGIYTDGISVESTEIHGLARVEKASFQWDKKAAWGCEVTFDKFNPAVIHPEFPGLLNGVLVASGTWSEKGVLGELELQEISGDLRGKELRGNGNVHILEDSIESSGLSLHLGSSELTVKGGMADEIDLGFRFHSPQLETLFPGATGSLEIAGSLSGSDAKPILRVDVTGSGVTYAEFGADSLASRLDAEILENGAIDFMIAGEDLFLSDIHIAEGLLQISGNRLAHSIEANISNGSMSVGIFANGEYSEDWNGQINNSYIKSGKVGDWEQLDSAVLHIGGASILLGDFCLGYDQANVCGAGELLLNEMSEWSVEIEMERLSLNLLNRFQLIPNIVSGIVAAKASIKGNRKGLTGGTGNLKLPEVKIHFDTEEPEGRSICFLDSFLNMNLTDGVLQAAGSIQEQAGGKVEFDLQLTDFGEFDLQFPFIGLEGDLALHEMQLSFLDGLTHHGIQPKGAVDGSLHLGGTLADPVLSGDVVLLDGGIELPYQGVMLEKIDFHFEKRGSSTKVKGQVVSGDGSLFANGIVDYNETGIMGNLHLNGDNFLLVNLPEYSFKVNPDVVFTFSEKNGKINGIISVPHGRIVPEELRNSVKASEDVVLISQDEVKKKQGWPFHLDLRVLLGDDVTINGYGLSGRLGGNLQVKITPDDFITGRGELDLLDGRFSLYGRSLDIERGRVLFTGGPIDNPGVDVRAQKVVSDEEAAGKGYTVGVDISGLVQDLKFHLFSEPYMADTEILSHMILGHSLAGSNEEEGNLLQAAASKLGLAGGSELLGKLGGLLFIDDMHLEGSAKKEDVSLVVGKRITEDLYIGYDMNMFSQLGRFRVRYDLKGGFWVETRSSSESTGADLMYSFER